MTDPKPLYFTSDPSIGFTVERRADGDRHSHGRRGAAQGSGVGTGRPRLPGGRDCGSMGLARPLGLLRRAHFRQVVRHRRRLLQRRDPAQILYLLVGGRRGMEWH